MSEITLDRVLGVLGLITGIIGIWLARHYYIKSIRKKLLAISFTNPLPLMLPVEGVQVLYNNHPEAALSRVYILFWNKGTEAIEQSDFLRPITFKSQEKILSISVDDKDAAASGDLHPAEKYISIKLLRPNEAIVLRVDARDPEYRPDIVVDMKSLDMSSALKSRRAALPNALSAMIAAIPLVVGVYLINAFELKALSPNTWLYVASFIVIFVAIAFCIGLFGMYSEQFLTSLVRQATPSVVWRYLERQKSLGAALRHWRFLKESVDSTK
jgi:hypothetical protein